MAYKKYTLLANAGNYGTTRSTSCIKYLVYHYTGNRTDKAVSNATYFEKNVVKASAHYFVDESTVYQSVPDTKIAWAVGGAKYSSCATTGGGTMYGKITNTNSLSIEMCSTNGVITETTISNAVALGKELMRKYNIPASNVYRHFDVVGKLCPGWNGWCGKDSSKWEALKAKLSGTTTASTTSTSKTTVTYISHTLNAGNWNSEITGYNNTNTKGYSGVIGKSIDKVAIKLSKGTITYIAHRDGKWGNAITGYSITDTNKYAGSTGKAIDSITMKATGITGTLKYRVHRKADNQWGNWITGYSKTDTNKYAGSIGKEIDAIQIGIE